MPITNRQLAESLRQIKTAPDPLANIQLQISNQHGAVDLQLAHQYRREIQEAIAQTFLEIQENQNLRSHIINKL